MFDLFKIISMVALLDYIIYNYYTKIYKIKISKDTYKYRLIACSVFWFIILFCLRFNIVYFELKCNYFLYISLISFVLYLLFHMYNKYYYNYSLQFMCADTFYGVLISNLLIVISFFI